MDAAQRREQIKQILGRQTAAPISASRLARQFHVSRQIIVGDIALLRAAGCDIIATARGYLLEDGTRPSRYVGKVACQHNDQDTLLELYTIVDLGGEVVDVIVEHSIYGELAGQLNLRCRDDVNIFINKAQQSGVRLLSELTGGVHLHTVACRDEDAFLRIRQALSDLGLLYTG